MPRKMIRYWGKSGTGHSLQMSSSRNRNHPLTLIVVSLLFIICQRTIKPERCLWCLNSCKNYVQGNYTDSTTQYLIREHVGEREWQGLMYWQYFAPAVYAHERLGIKPWPCIADIKLGWGREKLLILVPWWPRPKTPR